MKKALCTLLIIISAMMLLSCEPEFPPGTKFSYSNTDYTLPAEP